ncbi:MAG: hypothetical protein K2K56_12795 [Lachnospiraceae bacterium]|nr:hypothetical protein [Lachnospiraceae bacterium]
MKKSGDVKKLDIKSTMDLWNTFEKAANFKKNFYDKELERQIRNNLGLPDTISIKKSLKNDNDNIISIEDLLFAILTAMQPFSQMICDLLKMFEKASAGQGDYNLQIKMKFKRKSNELKFNLEEFRQCEKTTEEICEKGKGTIPRDIHKLVDIFRNHTNFININFIEQKDIDQWLDEYDNEDRWPDFIPQRPSMVEPRLDKLTAKCWNIFRIVVAECREAYDETKGRKRTIQDECSRNVGKEFWKAEQNSWTREFLHIVCCAASVFQKTMMPEDVEDEAKGLVGDLREYFQHVEVEDVDHILVQRTVYKLTEVLNLPFWKRRYELYSAWVSTQIVEALQDRDIEFQVVDNTLSFSFKGSHIATCTGLVPPLEIWAELRTDAENLIGSGREKAIQPDYTLAVPEAKKPNNSVAVIECKQYEKPSMRNFRAAIIDYANGRPQAVIMLTGYGKIPKKLHEKIEDEQIKSRSVEFSFMRPESLSAQEFKEKLRETVLEYYCKKAKENKGFLRPWRNPLEAVSVSLKWGEHPREVESRLCIMEGSQEVVHLSFCAKGNEGQIRYVYLNEDIALGSGPEIVRVSRWTEADYLIEVHVSSSESERVLLDVEVCCGQDTFCFQRCNLTGVDNWNVFRMNRKGIETWHLTDRA